MLITSLRIVLDKFSQLRREFIFSFLFLAPLMVFAGPPDNGPDGIPPGGRFSVYFTNIIQGNDGVSGACPTDQVIIGFNTGLTLDYGKPICKKIIVLPDALTGQTLRYTGTGWVVNNLLYNNGTNIGINTTNPATKLDVNGSLFTRGAQAHFDLSFANSGSVHWVKLGTLTAAQGGINATLRLFGGSGYNADSVQNGEAEVNIRTSNGASVNASGFCASSIVKRSGRTQVFTNLKIVGNATGCSATSYDVYILAAAFIGRSYYTVDTDYGTTWSHVLAVGQADPGVASSTVLIPDFENVINENLSVIGNQTVSGNLGVGTPTPGYKLDVSGTGNFTGLRLPTGAGNTYILTSDATGNARWLANNYVESDPQVGANTTNYLSKWNGSALITSQVFDNGTNVGIGTGAPGAKLDVNGSAIFRNTVTMTPNKNIEFQSPGIGSTTPGGFRWLLTTDQASMYALENATDNTDYVFKLGDNATDDGDRFVFWNNSWNGIASDRWPIVMNGTWAAFDPRFSGNTSTGSITSATMYLNYVTRDVGIGTTSPGQKLDVSGGSIRTTNQFISTLATGTAPLAVSSTTVNTNLNADMVDELHVNSTTTNNEVNKIVRTDGSGYANFGWINTTSGDNGTTAISRIYASSDGYIRYYTPANFKTNLSLVDRSAGTLNYIPKWTPDGDTLGDSQIFDNGTNVGIGTATPGANFDVAGRTIKTSNTYPLYRWYFGGNQDLTWKKIADVTMTNGLYAAISLQVIIKDAMTNFGSSASTKDIKFYVAARRSGGVQDDLNDGLVSGPVSDYVRLVKTALGVYELQVRQPADWKHLEVSSQVISQGGSTTLSYVTNPAVGSSGGTIYLATPQNTEYFSHVNIAGNIQSSGSFLDFTINNPQLRVISGPGTIGIGDDDNVSLSSGRLYVRNDGNVGIGTINPSQKLDVSGTGQFTGLRLPTGASSGYILTSDSLGNAQWQIPNDSTGGLWRNIPLSNTTKYDPLCYYQVRFAENGTGTYINNLYGSGNVWVNVERVTENFLSLIIINGSPQLSYGVPSSAKSTYGYRSSDTGIFVNMPEYPIQEMRFLCNIFTGTGLAEDDPQVGTITTNYLSKWNGSALVTSQVFDNGTNMGIGTATPGYRLDVSGTGQFTGLRLPTGAGNNYILASDASGNARWASSSSTETDPIWMAQKGSYATNTGVGASGTWGINITGNAATATNASTVTNGVYTTTSHAGDVSGVYNNLQLGAGVVTSADIATDTITAGNIAASAVGTSEIADSTVSSTDVGFNYAGSSSKGGNATTADAVSFNGGLTTTSSPTFSSLTISNGQTVNGDLTVVGKVITDTLVNRTVAQLTVSGSILPNATSSQKDLGATGNRWANLWLSGNATIGGNANVTGSVTANSFAGNGSAITSLSPANISAGTAGISITGNAATATNATTATTASAAPWSGITGKPTTIAGYGITDMGSQSVNYANSAGNAGTVGGLAVHAGRNNEVNKIVRTDANGYIQAGWINTPSGDNGVTALTKIYASNDDYIRYYTPANFRQVLDVPTRTGGNASGTWGISISGNAENVTTPTATYKHLGAWGVGRTAVGAILVNTAYLADNASAVPWSGVTGKPTTVGGYGITDMSSQSVNYANSAGSATNATNATNFQSTSHPGTYWLNNAWDGARWNITSNHGAAVRVGYADAAGSASSVPWSGISSLPAFAANQNAGRVRMYEVGCSGSYASSCDGNTNGWSDYADTAPWSGISSKPTTVGGYGITDMGSQSVNYATTAGTANAVSFNGGLTTGSSPTFNYINASYNTRFGEIWGYGGVYRSSGDMMFGTEGGNWRFHSSNSQKAVIATNGNLWMEWAGDWLSNLLNAKANTGGGNASGTWPISITGNANYANTAGSAYPTRVGGVVMQFNWSGQGGQPNWLWGGGDGTNMYVYNPSNFSVNYANSAGTANAVSFNGGLTTSSAPTFAEVTATTYRAAGSLHVQAGGAGNLYLNPWNGSAVYIGGGGGNGQLYAQGYSYYSDKRLKENLHIITGSLDRIQKINGYTFDWKNTGKRDLGVIAQEVEKVFPELVGLATSSSGETNKTVEYGNLVAPLIEAVKELKTEKDREIRSLQVENSLLKSENESIKTRLELLEKAVLNSKQ